MTAGTIEVGPDGQPQRFHAALDPASIDTGHARRDGDLRGKRFLAVDAYPTMEIVAERIETTAGGWRADALLRGHGCEAPLRIDATLDGAAAAPCLQVIEQLEAGEPAGMPSASRPGSGGRLGRLARSEPRWARWRYMNLCI